MQGRSWSVLTFFDFLVLTINAYNAHVTIISELRASPFKLAMSSSTIPVKCLEILFFERMMLLVSVQCLLLCVIAYETEDLRRDSKIVSVEQSDRRCLVRDANTIKVFFKDLIFEFCAVVGSYDDDRRLKKDSDSLQEGFNHFWCFIF
ncbi:hypothetical protein Tco_1338424 [Tanacetum coccineum]